MRPPLLAALTLPWSTGQVEGHIHRLKLVKRQMYGPGEALHLKVSRLGARVAANIRRRKESERSPNILSLGLCAVRR
jgi:hypothetical protein